MVRATALALLLLAGCEKPYDETADLAETGHVNARLALSQNEEQAAEIEQLRTDLDAAERENDDLEGRVRLQEDRISSQSDEIGELRDKVNEIVAFVNSR